MNKFIAIPETTLPGGLIVPAFEVGQYLTGRAENGQLSITAEAQPWTNIFYSEARIAAEAAGGNLITETQALAIAWNISQKAINWTGGNIGHGSLYQGLRNDTFNSAQPANVETDDSQRRWHELPNGDRIWDFAGNAFTWIFDDVQGDENGLTTVIKADSPTLTTAPYPPCEKGMGWRPDGQRDWSGVALVRGGCWYSESLAGVFRLGGGWPGNRGGNVGFRCTKPIGL